jgi:hypothetical protein
MRAMTWWDHETGSVWSQVWGQAIAGPLKGTTLNLIPASIVPWGTWKSEHPDTLAMITDKSGRFSRTEQPRDSWVIGIVIDADSKAFPYKRLAQERIVNDFVGSFPVAVYVDPETRNVHAYLRQIDDQLLTLQLDDSGEHMIDQETGTIWNIERGLAEDGPLAGESLLLVPYISSFDWAWFDFHPESELYE